MEQLDVLIVGAGMYVAGRGTDGFGTIMPALLEGRRRGLIGRLGVVATSPQSAGDVRNRAQELGTLMGVDGAVEAFPRDEDGDGDFLDTAKVFKPTATIVSVPDHLHADICVPLMELGIHCLVVKPLASTLEEGLRMARAAEKRGVVAQVEFHKRLDESNVLLRDAVQSGRIGEPLYAVIEYSQQKRIPRDAFRSWAAKTSIFQYLGVHYVDLIQFVTGYKPVQVTAWGQGEYLKEQGIDALDAMQVVVQWDKGDGRPFVSTHITNWIDPDETTAMSDQKINIVGSAGRFQADQKHRGVQLVTDQAGVRDLNPYFCSARRGADGKVSHVGYGIDSVLQFVQDVQAVDAGHVEIADLVDVRPSMKQCVISTAVVDAAHSSLALGSTPVNVDSSLFPVE